MIKIIPHEEIELKKLTTKQLKIVVIEGIEAAGRAGFALRVIRDEKRFLEDGYKSFKEFCGKEFHKSRIYAYNLIQGADAIASLPEETRKLVKNAAAASAVAKLKLPDRKKAVETAAKNSKTGQATASGIKKAATEKPQEPPKRNILFDKEGIEVPQEIEELWTRGRNEMSEFVDEISRLIGRFESYKREDDILFVEIGNGMDNLISKLKSVRQETELTIPHTVCPSCNGVLECDKCTTCKGRGFISKFYFITHIPSDHIRKQGKK